ncbi:receptor protein-tyrosine kinase CEPR1-like [Salvia miltiorrhiza]|uniref:receptor protein-tyrosine kinase CEPR1-like n=1 Tax=Salvia miltiorrhiza TaxID=226208 RepID=UPI0025AC3F02|nr:receptor protein-tyrosine kinase CEPR1-like [Salvia miltiorrhiza]
MAPKHHLLLLLLMLSTYTSFQTNPNNQTYFFHLINNYASGNSLSSWDSTNGKTYCYYAGVTCDDEQNIVGIDISGWSLSGTFPPQVCSYLPKLRLLRLGHNNFHGELPLIANCSFLEELNASSLYLTGHLPDFTPLSSLRVLDLSYNLFSGDFPLSLTNLTNLEVLNFNENPLFNLWELPETIAKLIKLKSLILSTCMLRGKIPTSVWNITSLIDLELSGNYLAGRLPKEVGLLQNLQHLELYYNELEGEIPVEIGNLTQLVDLDMSVNKLSGRIPASVCRLPKLRVFQLYNNSLVGEIPSDIANSTSLNTLSLYENLLSGEVPRDLGRSSAMVALDLAENELSGRLPEGLCSGGKLNYLLVLQNKFTGEIPKSYAECKSIVRFRVSNNNLGGEIPQGVFSLPLAWIIDLGYNNFVGSISPSIGNARNLSQLFLQGNRISGSIPAEISLATSLVKIDLSNNLLSDAIPSQIGSLRRLNILMLHGNKLNSSIPESLSSLKSLNALDLSQNCLTGEIPESMSKLLPTSLNFSNNHLSGVIPIPFTKGGMLESFVGNPNLCLPAEIHSSSPQNFSICSQRLIHSKKNTKCVWLTAILFMLAIALLGMVLVLKRWYGKERKVVETEDHTLSSSCFSYDMKSFHRLSFDQREITDAMVEKNIVGYGSSGTVYKIELSSGEVVAAKKLWSRKASEEQVVMEKELVTEVETLGSIRHKNIMKLYSYLSSLDCSLLVYEYMPNGNLWDAIHRGKVVLDWPIRHQIAVGVAQGLAYLHHHLMPPIIHRDIKSTNILLDVNYEAKLADFGIAKILQARGSKDSTTTVIAGTYGYLAPEYAYSSRATTKCDVYSFGVVLLELVTGKKPVEAVFGEGKNIVSWASGKADVVDKRVSGLYEDDMLKVLTIALRCTCGAPALRPTMNEVAQHLIEADPCKFNCCKFSKDVQGILPDPTKPKDLIF